MAFKYRKQISVFPAFYLNLNKSGMSATVGMRKLNVNMGQIGRKDDTNNIFLNDNKPETLNVSDDVVEIKSYQPELITSEGLYGLKESILNAQKVKEELRKESVKLSTQKIFSLVLMVISYILIFGIFVKWFKENYFFKSNISEDAKKTYQNFKLDIEFNMDNTILDDYITLKSNYEQLMGINTIWDITSAKSVDRVKERSAASTVITRNKVKFSKSSLDYINTEYEALRFQNANGGDLFLYPGFIVMVSNNSFALIDFREIEIEHHAQEFIETGGVPKDSKIIDYTWKYVNKNGTPDKRYKSNFQIPIALYYEITIKSTKGLYESYQFSNAEIGKKFCNSFETYKASLYEMNWQKDKD